MFFEIAQTLDMQNKFKTKSKNSLGFSMVFQDKFDVIVQVDTIAACEAQRVPMFVLVFICVEQAEFGCTWQVVDQS